MTTTPSDDRPHRAGQVALVGRPNVGKSTLLNALVGTKLAIVTPKPQTTRNRICGIRTLPHAQIAFLDTPGIHAARSALNRRMVEVARRTLEEADAVILVLDATAGLGPAERELATALVASGLPVVAALNKIDRMAKPALLPVLQQLGELLPGRDLVPVSALRGEGVERLLDVVVGLLPEGPASYAEDEFTTATERFLAAELVREQVFLATREEVPYGTAVEIERFEEQPDRKLVVISAAILVERESHKGMILGAKGETVKRIGIAARTQLEELLGSKVFLELFVRVEPGWARSSRRLAELGL